MRKCPVKFLVALLSTVIPSRKVKCVGNVGWQEKILVSLSVQGRQERFNLSWRWRERFKLSMMVDQSPGKVSPAGSKNTDRKLYPDGFNYHRLLPHGFFLGKARPRSAPSTNCSHWISGSLLHSPIGVLFTFPSRYLYANLTRRSVPDVTSVTITVREDYLWWYMYVSVMVPSVTEKVIWRRI